MDEGERQLLGSQFDLDARGYDDGRPDYPEEAWARVLDHARLGSGATVLEIGPGTGQATRRLLGTGATVHAVEPGASLAALLRERFPRARLTVDVAPLEAVALADHSFDAVCAATSFHWVDPDAGLAALRRVLRPGGAVCLWWNVYRDLERVAVDPTDVLIRSSTDLPNSRGLNGILDELDLPRRLAESGFVEIEASTVHWEHTHDEESLIALFRSFSDMRKREPGERERMLAALRNHVRAAGGEITRAYTTPILLARAPG